MVSVSRLFFVVLTQCLNQLDEDGEDASGDHPRGEPGVTPPASGLPSSQVPCHR